MRVKIAQPSAKTIVTQLELVGLRGKLVSYAYFLTVRTHFNVWYFIIRVRSSFDRWWWRHGLTPCHAATSQRHRTTQAYSGFLSLFCMGSPVPPVYWPYARIRLCKPRLDLQNILRQSYDYLTIMAKLRPTYEWRLIYRTSYEGRKAFLGYSSLAKS